ncbi:MAG: hypothetical protein AB7F88_15670 [Pyrinomonadaceae bacterium]
MKCFTKASGFFLIFLIAAASGMAQDQPREAERSYEAVLYVLASDDRAGKGTDLPSGLNAVSRQIRSEFGADRLRVINTYFGRLSGAGTIEYKGVSNAYAPEAMPGSPSFLDWRLSGLRDLENAAGQPVYQFQAFRFGARVPVRIGVVSDERAAPINYEPIGLTVERVGVRDNDPTLIGTLIQPRTDGTLFLVLTVRKAENERR